MLGARPCSADPVSPALIFGSGLLMIAGVLLTVAVLNRLLGMGLFQQELLNNMIQAPRIYCDGC